MDSATYNPSTVPHPGDTVIEYLDFHGWSQRDLSRRTGVTPKTISELCNGKTSLSPSTALALEKCFRRPAHFWLALQSRFDEATARTRESILATDWTSWLKRFPIAEMRKRKWLPRSSDSQAEDISSLLQFLGVSSPDNWDAVWAASQVAYRQTRKFTIRNEAVAAWVRETEIEAQALDVSEYNEQKLHSHIPQLRRHTTMRIDAALTATQELCATAGVALVLVPELTKTGISGCARWLSNRKAMIALTLRYKTDDQLWFSFFHELGHILKHRKQLAFVLDNADEALTDGVVDPDMQKFEDEANLFAANTLIPPHALKSFISRRNFTNITIKGFADKIETSPGIVVGRLQHEGLLTFGQGNRLKQRISWGTQDM